MDHINNEIPICLVITGDLNDKCSKWCNKDITNSVGREIYTLTSSAGYNQFINKPNHFLNNSSSCIYLIFCNNLNLPPNYGVDLSLFEKCHHNIIFDKISIRILLPPSYVCKVWDYSRADTKNIQKAVRNFDGEKAFGNLSVDRKVDLLNETLLNIFRKTKKFRNKSCILHKASICTLINNGSIMPQFAYKTNVRINSFCISHNDISLIIKNLDSNKAHGCDNISIKIIQICDESIALPLKLLFERALKEKKFPDLWKLVNVVPVYRKEDKKN